MNLVFSNNIAFTASQKESENFLTAQARLERGNTIGGVDRNTTLFTENSKGNYDKGR